MTPPTLNARRISSLFASRPLVRIEGAAGPAVASATRTGVGASGASFAALLQPAAIVAQAVMRDN